MLNLDEKTRRSVYIVAEIGQNHQGSLEVAKLMIREAKACGADCVKFQKSNLGEKFTKSTLDRLYDSENSFGLTYGEHKAHLEFSMQQMKQLRECAQLAQIDFGVSPMDPVSMREMIDLGPSFIKIGSGDTDNFSLVEMAAKSELPIILSTGMQTNRTINRAVELLKKWSRNYAVLHCISSYPTAESDINLNQMLCIMQNNPNAVVGYSGHEVGFLPSLAAVALGARIIERHFTLDKTLKGSDHKCSLDSSELSRFVALVRASERVATLESHCPKIQITKWFQELELSSDCNEKHMDNLMGTPRSDSIYPCEESCKNKLGKSIVYRNALKSGACLQSTDLCIKVSNEKGISPNEIDCTLGQVLGINVDKDQVLRYDHFQK